MSSSFNSCPFEVKPTKDTTYTLEVKDSLGCKRTATKDVTASPLPAPDFTFTKPDCTGQTTLTATPSGLASYTWFDGATQIGTGNPLTVTLAQDGQDHSITVKVTNSAGQRRAYGPSVVGGTMGSGRTTVI